jgi:DNA helicase-2/ATP-dependent DNA helicase PcrA
LDEVLYGASVRPDSASTSAQFEIGDAVIHKTFGKGMVKGIEGDSLTIRFEGPAGTKKLLAGYAPIVKVSTH